MKTVMPVSEVILETNLVYFSPHYDDFLLGLGGYALVGDSFGASVALALAEGKSLEAATVFANAAADRKSAASVEATRTLTRTSLC